MSKKTLTADDLVPKRGWSAKKAKTLPGSKPIDVVQWVARYLEVRDVKPTDAPTPEHWALLDIVRSSPQTRWDFWKTMWSRMIPSQAALEAQARFDDDGRDNEALIEDLQESIQSSGPENETGEPGVAQGADTQSQE